MMRKKAAAYFLVVVFVCMSIFTGCNSAETTFKESTKSENKNIELNLQNCVDGYVKKEQINGAVLIARNGDILLNRGYGMADFSKNIKNTPNTVTK